jgi:hypothetical protein
MFYFLSDNTDEEIPETQITGESRFYGKPQKQKKSPTPEKKTFAFLSLSSVFSLSINGLLLYIGYFFWG